MLILFFYRFLEIPTREGSAGAETRKRRLAIYAGRAYFVAVMSVPAKQLIYFCGSIRGGRDDAALYKRIIDQLKQYGEVLTEHIGDPNLMEKEKGMTIKNLSNVAFTGHSSHPNTLIPSTFTDFCTALRNIFV